MPSSVLLLRDTNWRYSFRVLASYNNTLFSIADDREVCFVGVFAVSLVNRMH